MSKWVLPISLAALALSLVTAVLFGLIWWLPQLDRIVSALAVLSGACAAAGVVLALVDRRTDIVWIPIIALVVSVLAWSYAPAVHQRRILDQLEEDIRQRGPLIEQLRRLPGQVQPAGPAEQGPAAGAPTETTTPEPEPRPQETPTAPQETQPAESAQDETGQSTARGIALDLRPQQAHDPAAVELEQRVAALATEWSGLDTDAVWKQVNELRQEAVRLEHPADAQGIHVKLDQIVLTVLEGRARPALAEARRQFADGELEKVIENCTTVIDAYQAQNVPALSQAQMAEPPLLTEARMLLNETGRRKRLIDNPSERFAIRGFLKGPKGVSVNLEDLLTGEKRRLQVHDSFGEFQVEQIDENGGRVVLARGRNSFDVMK